MSPTARVPAAAHGSSPCDKSANYLAEENGEGAGLGHAPAVLKAARKL